MRKKGTFLLACAVVALVVLLVYAPACQREPVYIGALDPDPTDTTDNGGGDPVTHPCDPDSVYFNQQILPILTSNCAMAECHDALSHEEGVILDNYLHVRNSGQINLNNPANSKLYRVLNDPDPGDRMPPAPMPALTADERALILLWIQQGAQDLSCDAECDTTNVTFSGSVFPLIQTKCEGCHSGANPQGGVALTNFNQVRAAVNNGSLLGSITHAAGFTAMPYPAGSAKLPDCDIRMIQIWIENGAPND